MQLSKRLELDYSAEHIQERVTLAALSDQCQGLFERIACGASGHPQCLWGNLQVGRATDEGGVRFELGGCPNHLAWSVTRVSDEAGDGIVVQCRVNQEQWDEAFIRSVQGLLDSLAGGVAAALQADAPVQADPSMVLPACGPLGGSSRLS